MLVNSSHLLMKKQGGARVHSAFCFFFFLARFKIFTSRTLQIAKSSFELTQYDRGALWLRISTFHTLMIFIHI